MSNLTLLTTLFLRGMLHVAACSEIAGPTDDLQNVRGMIKGIKTESLRSEFAIVEIRRPSYLDEVPPAGAFLHRKRVQD